MTADTPLSVGRQYFEPFRDALWNWSGDRCAEIEQFGSVANGKNSFAIPHGRLIAFRQEVKTILEALQPGGWPEFSVLLLLIAACRDNWPEHRRWAEQLCQLFGGEQGSEILAGLEAIHELPKARRETTQAKVELVRFVFGETRDWYPPDRARLAYKYLSKYLPLKTSTVNAAHDSNPFVDPRWPSQRRQLLNGLKRLTPETVELRQETGLDTLVCAAVLPQDTDPATHGARLTAWLNDSELGSAARIARRLISVLSWPRAIGDPDGAPIGGVSDLSNRGELDRLLLSELAHDDDTLPTRIALREALYLRRESPASRPPRRRPILLDAGPRMWGVPRVYGAATVLAIAAAEDTESELTVDVSVADIDGVRTVDLRTRDGVVSLLAALSPRAISADDLLPWLDTVRRSTSPQTVVEPVVVTSFDSADDPEFRAALGRLKLPEYDVVVVDRSGRLETRHFSRRGERVTRAMTLDLDALLSVPNTDASVTTSSSLLTPGIDVYPSILRMRPFPLRLSHQLQNGQVWPDGGGGLLCLATERRLMWWNSRQFGAIEFAERIPVGRVIAWRNIQESWENNEPLPRYSWSLVGSQTGWWLLMVDLWEQTVATRQLQSEFRIGDPQVQGLLIGESVFLLRPDLGQIELLSSTDGKLIERSHGEPFHFYGNRWLRFGDRFKKLCEVEGWAGPIGYVNGIEIVAIEFPSPDTIMYVDQLDNSGDKEQPTITLRRKGNQLWLQSGEEVFGSADLRSPRIDFAHQYEDLITVTADLVGPDNLRRPRGTPTTLITDLLCPSEWNLAFATAKQALFQQLAKRASPRHTLRHKFSAIGLGDGGVWLRASSKGNWWGFEFGPLGGWLNLRPHSTTALNVFAFEQFKWPGSPYHFRRTTLPNGTQVWLDSRGLLHLLPADGGVEATIVLDEKHLAGWCSDGTLWGDPYYTGADDAGDPLGIWRSRLTPLFGVVR